LVGTKRKNVATGHVLWVPNVPKMLLRPGLCPAYRWGNSALPDALAGFKGAASWREGREGRGGKGRREYRERKGRK